MCRKKGHVIKAILADITAIGDKLYFFEYNKSRFFNRNNSKYYNRKKIIVGDSLSFYYWSQIPNVFVPVEKTTFDFYTDFAIYFFLILVGVYCLVYYFNHWHRLPKNDSCLK